MKLEEYEKMFSWINWRKPIRITVLGGVSKYFCRVCVANHGIKASEVGEFGFDTEEEAEAHIKEHEDL